MVASPADVERRALRRERLLASRREGLIALRAGDGGKAAEHVGEEEAHPHAGANLAAAKQVDAVVPVAGAQQRKTVLGEMVKGEGDGEPGVLVRRWRSRARRAG